jgi:hypothetical protein
MPVQGLEKRIVQCSILFRPTRTPEFFFLHISLLGAAKLTDVLRVQVNDFCLPGGSPVSQ